MASSFANPFERSRYRGSVSLVSPAIVRVNLPFATEVAPSQYAGHRVTRGQVGEFVVVPSCQYKHGWPIRVVMDLECPLIWRKAVVQ